MLLFWEGKGEEKKLALKNGGVHYNLFYFDQLNDGKIQNLSISLSCNKLQYLF